MKDIFDRVRDVAAELPEAEESTHYGTPAFKVRKKFFVRLHDLGDVLVMRIPITEREAWAQAEPEKYYWTPHYDGYPAMLVRLPAVTRAELQRVVLKAYETVAPRELVESLARPRSRTK